MVATMVVSCGKKKLEGEQSETKYFTVTMPQGWEQGGASQPDLSCMIHTEGTGKQPSIAFTAEELNPNMKAQSAAEKKDARISMNGYVDKGEMTFNDCKSHDDLDPDVRGKCNSKCPIRQVEEYGQEGRKGNG